MDQLLCFLSLQRFRRMERQCLRGRLAHARPQFLGESGEAVINLVVLLMSASLLYGGLFWLNKTYEKRTKEHLHDFETRWNHLEKKYEN